MNVPSQTFMQKVSDAALSGLSPLQAGLIVSTRSIDGNLTENLLGERVAELFSPTYLRRPELCDLFYNSTEPRNFFHAREAFLRQRSSQRIILSLAHGVYAYVENRVVAIEMANQINTAGRRHRANVLEPQSPSTAETLPTENGSNDQGSEEHAAHSVAMSFKKNEQRISGDLGKF